MALRPIIPPPVYDLAFAIAMIVTARAAPSATFSYPGQRVVGLALAALGLGVAILAGVQMARARTTVNPLNPERTSSLVSSGVFGISRNPIYLGMLIILCGVAAWLANLVSALFLPLFVLVITVVQIKPEERALAALFGDDFAAYSARVNRWFGRRGAP